MLCVDARGLGVRDVVYICRQVVVVRTQAYARSRGSSEDEFPSRGEMRIGSAGSWLPVESETRAARSCLPAPAPRA